MFRIFLRNFFVISVMFVLKHIALADELELQDPTQPVDYKETRSQNSTGKQEFNGVMTLEAIIISGDYKLCIVGGKIAKIGDNLADKKVIAIEHDRVILKDKSDKNFILKLSDPDIKEPSDE